jgi:hypothetical protein
MEGLGVVEAFSAVRISQTTLSETQEKSFLHQKLLPVAEFIDPDFIPQSWIYEFGYWQ